jgi:type IV secretion system protein VirB1
LALAAQCAPSVAPETLLSVVHVESRFNPLAIGVNGAPRVSVTATTKADAVARATALIKAGRSVDLGLAQINSKNLDWLGLSVADTFDPCRNLAAAARVLQAGYEPAAPDGEQAALRRAFSRYNTGTAHRGFANGYVAKVTAAAAKFAHQSDPAEPAIPAALSPGPPAWDVFGEAGRPGFLIRVDSPNPGDRP